MVSGTIPYGKPTTDELFISTSLGDDFLAAFIMKFATKQEHINEILESEGSNYRIGGLEVEVGVPPKAVFVVEKQSG